MASEKTKRRAPVKNIQERPKTVLPPENRTPYSQTSEIEAYLHEVSEQALKSPAQVISKEDTERAAFGIPKEYQSAFVTFESPLMEYIRNLQDKITLMPKELSFMSSIYTITRGEILKIIDHRQEENVKDELYRVLYPLALNTKNAKRAVQKQLTDPEALENEVNQILSRCYLVIFSNFSQMQAAIIQGIIYDIERQGVHLPIQSSHELETIAQQYRPIVQNQAIIIRNMFRHLFPQYSPPDNIHVLELCFLGILEQIQQNFQVFLQDDEQLLQMLSRIKVAQDELLHVKDPQLSHILVKMEHLQNRFHDIYNQRWHDGILNDIISLFFYHARFTAYLENTTKISQKRRYFLASLEHLINNYEDFYKETLLPQIEFLMSEQNKVDEEGYTYINTHIHAGAMRQIFQTCLDEDRFAVLSDMIVTGEFSKTLEYNDLIQYTEELEKMRKELSLKHKDNVDILSYINQLWEVIDDLQEVMISEIFNRWKAPLTTLMTTYFRELFWFHSCFSTYTLDAFPQKSFLIEQLDRFLGIYRNALDIFSRNILQQLESLSQQVYAFRDRAGDFNLLYTGILAVNLKKEEKQFQFELYTPAMIKNLAKELIDLQEKYVHSLQTPPVKLSKSPSPTSQEDQKNLRLYTDELLKTASTLAEEKEILMYFGSRKLFTGPHFVQEDFAGLYKEIIKTYDHAITRLIANPHDPLDSIIELRSLRERANFEVVYERYTETIKYKALKKAWQLIRDRNEG